MQAHSAVVEQTSQEHGDSVPTVCSLQLRRIVILCGVSLLLLYIPYSTEPKSDVDSEDLVILNTKLYEQTDSEILEDAARRMPSLPVKFWNKNKNVHGKFFKRQDCAPFPSIYDLVFANTYWQTLKVGRGTFHIWSAYMDKRPTSKIGPTVRLLAVFNFMKPNITYCQFWFKGRIEPVIVRTREYKYIWNSHWGNNVDGIWQPFLLTCVLPAQVRDLIPATVSLVRKPCQRATNWLTVHYDIPKAGPGHPDHELAVCVKGLDFLHKDISLKLVEWIELVLLMGASHVYFYELNVHPNITKVLEYYSSRGSVTVTPTTLPGGRPNVPSLQHMYLKKKTPDKRQMELIPYNDCLYRNMYRYRRLVLLDLDEIIVPVQDDDWISLMRRIDSLTMSSGKSYSSYYASNLYYLTSLQRQPESVVPRYMHMLQHVYRTNNFTKPGQYVKSFHETSRVLLLHNHFPLACIGGGCSPYALPKIVARLQHYRADCDKALSTSCTALKKDPVRDVTLWRWREPLIARVNRALRDLGYLVKPTPKP